MQADGNPDSLPRNLSMDDLQSHGATSRGHDLSTSRNYLFSSDSTRTSSESFASETRTGSEKLELIRVHIHDSHASSTTLRIGSRTTSADICTSICDKLKIPEHLRAKYALVLVLSSMREFLPKTEKADPYRCMYSVLHTLAAAEGLCQARDTQVSKFKRKIEQEEILVASPSLPSNVQVSRTSDPQYMIRWFFTDTSAGSLDVEGEVSGSSDSEDETPMHQLEIDNLRRDKSHRSGYILRKSRKDANVWRKRMCLLTDKLWCIRDRGQVIVASHVPLAHSVLEELSRDVARNERIPYGFEIQTPQHVYIFKCDSRSVQQGWINDIRRAISFTTENELMHLAEMIISDEQHTSTLRLQKAISKLLDSKSIQYNLAGAQHMRLQSSLHTLERREHIATSALSFVTAVERFKQRYRHELRVPVENLWQAALMVFINHLQNSFVTAIAAAEGGTDETEWALPLPLTPLLTVYSKLTEGVCIEEDQPRVNGDNLHNHTQRASLSRLMSFFSHSPTPDISEPITRANPTADSDSDLTDDLSPEDLSFSTGWEVFPPPVCSSDASVNPNPGSPNSSPEVTSYAVTRPVEPLSTYVEVDVAQRCSSVSNSDVKRLRRAWGELKASWLLKRDLGQLLRPTPSLSSRKSTQMRVPAKLPPVTLKFANTPPPIDMFDNLVELTQQRLQVADWTS